MGSWIRTGVFNSKRVLRFERGLVVVAEGGSKGMVQGGQELPLGSDPVSIENTRMDFLAM